MSLISKEHLNLTLQSIKKLLFNKADKSEVESVQLSVGLKADKRELEEEIARVYDNIAQSDWNQNDESAIDYIKNRPFYDTTELKQLDEKYIPDTIARAEDVTNVRDALDTKISFTTTAEVGQAIIVKSVDENGKPTEWEPIHLLYKDNPNDYVLLNDVNTEIVYKIEVRDGNLVSSMHASLDDFTYTANDDGTYTITGWKQTYMGEPSTIMIVPNDPDVII